MLLMPFHRRHTVCLALLMIAGDSLLAEETGKPPAGQRLFFTGHSFHMFVPRNFDLVVAAAGIQGHKTVGTQGIGGSRVIQHWDLPDERNKAKPALAGGDIDIYTMAAHLEIPDPGINHFVELGLKHNPHMRFLVQASWFPYDVPGDGRIRDNRERDNAKIENLQAAVDNWRKQLEKQVDDLNQQHGKTAVGIIPAGDAVIQLRALVVDGRYPGITRQSELFRDPIGHGGGHVHWLVTYCNFAAIYRTPPTALADTADGVSAAQHEILKNIAWAKVSAYPYAGVTLVNK